MDKFLVALNAILDRYAPVGDEERNNLYENVADGGNFDDTFQNGVELGERELADEIRDLIKEHNYE